MHARLQSLQEDHSRLRALLRNCETAGPRELAAALRRLEEVFVPHHQAKLALYDATLQGFQQEGDKTSVSVLTIFRANMRVMSAAIMGFLQSPDPDPARFHERFRAVASSLRSMLTTEEKVVFPLCIRYAQRSEVQS
ncbi:hemerythrin domain-containing protein [Hyalangium minutum]|uniref:Hemerythrin-like domain-containing protein n=1 Tax=Hyalangium minutum TaxID=394096 RepID=A0A085W3M2_9BACT|nr:hemerythrin domain-containing protein [Hyalangium minutum]KFE62285.1 hypothetical protein DB31_3995 [Hyalangium minutum]